MGVAAGCHRHLRLFGHVRPDVLGGGADQALQTAHRAQAQALEPARSGAALDHGGYVPDPVRLGVGHHLRQALHQAGGEHGGVGELDLVRQGVPQLRGAALLPLPDGSAHQVVSPQHRQHGGCALVHEGGRHAGAPQGQSPLGGLLQRWREGHFLAADLVWWHRRGDRAVSGFPHLRPAAPPDGVGQLHPHRRRPDPHLRLHLPHLHGAVPAGRGAGGDGDRRGGRDLGQGAPRSLV